jgi:hypothetical protein
MLTQEMKDEGFILVTDDYPKDLSRVLFITRWDSVKHVGTFYAAKNEHDNSVFENESGRRYEGMNVLAWKYEA